MFRKKQATLSVLRGDLSPCEQYASRKIGTSSPLFVNCSPASATQGLPGSRGLGAIEPERRAGGSCSCRSCGEKHWKRQLSRLRTGKIACLRFGGKTDRETPRAI